MDYDWRLIQTELRNMGFDPGPIDGIRGPKTDAAILAFREAHDIDIYDAATNSRLFAARDGGSAPLPWMKLALSKLGLHERANNATLRAFLASDGKTLGDPARQPWCGDFVETVMKLTCPAEPFPGALGENPYWARNWMFFGKPTAPTYGAVGVFSRDSGGHVGWLMGQEGNGYRVLGGNQRDAVTRTALLDKSRLLGARWPATFPVRPVYLPALVGGVLSTNEA
jgi:uncharacterized protein (TIGR02594 family)